MGLRYSTIFLFSVHLRIGYNLQKFGESKRTGFLRFFVVFGVPFFAFTAPLGRSIRKFEVGVDRYIGFQMTCLNQSVSPRCKLLQDFPLFSRTYCKTKTKVIS